MKQLIILDRDGIINFDSPNYIKSPDEWLPNPISLKAINKLTQANYTISVATNQSGIARGFYDVPTLDAIHDKMQHCVREAGGEIDSIFYCPHHPDELCDCRKPEPGLLHQIANHYQCDLTDVPFIGDRVSDLQCALRVGARPLFIESLYPSEQLPEEYGFIPCYSNLMEVVDELLGTSVTT